MSGNQLCYLLTAGSKPTILLSRYDSIQMEERPSLAAETQLIDDGSGNLKIFRIKQQDTVEIPKERHCFFFSGDCYIVLYSYEVSTEQKHILYCWLVSKTVHSYRFAIIKHDTKKDIFNIFLLETYIDFIKF